MSKTSDSWGEKIPEMTTSAFVETSAVIGPFWTFATLLLFAPCYSVKYHKNFANTEPQGPSLVEKKTWLKGDGSY